MKMKKYIGSIVGACALMMFAGCYEPLKITEEELDTVAEYAAGALVKHGTQSKEGLLTPEEQEEELARLATPTPWPTKAPSAPTEDTDGAGSGQETPAPTERPEATPVPDNTELTMQDLTDLIGKDGFFFQYAGCSTDSFYVGKGGMIANAGVGKKLLILKFEITNQSSGEAKLSMNMEKEKEYVYTLLVDGKSIRPSITLLEEDFYTSYTDTYKAGETKNCVLVFDCGEDWSLENSTLTIVRTVNGKEDSVLIKVK